MFLSLFKKSNVPRTAQTHVADRPLRSIVKAISWRIVGTLDTIVLSYFITGKAVMAFSIGGLEVFTKIILYFLHERAWAIVRWGRMMVVIRKSSRLTTKLFKRFTFLG